MMTKNEALELVQAHRLVVAFGLVLETSCNPSLTASVIRGQSYGFEADGVTRAVFRLDLLATILEDHRASRILLNNYRILLKHILVRDSYEIVAAYAYESGQEEKFKAWGPYNFVRFVRNTLSHREGAILHRWSPATLKSAEWRSRTITPADVGKPLVLQPAEYVELQEDLYNFLRDELT